MSRRRWCSRQCTVAQPRDQALYLNISQVADSCSYCQARIPRKTHVGLCAIVKVGFTTKIVKILHPTNLLTVWGNRIMSFLNFLNFQNNWSDYGQTHSPWTVLGKRRKCWASAPLWRRSTIFLVFILAGLCCHGHLVELRCGIQGQSFWRRFLRSLKQSKLLEFKNFFTGEKWEIWH